MTNTVVQETLEVAVDAESPVSPSGRPSYLVSIIEAGKNKSGKRVYPEHVLFAGVPLFENARIFVDHKNLREGVMASSRPEKRSFNDLAGVIKNVYFDQADQRMKGEATFFKDWINDIAASEPDLIRLSINADVKATRKRVDGQWIIIAKEILKVNSVDIVTVDGAGGKILKVLENYQGEDLEMPDKKHKDSEEEETTELTLESLREEHPDVVEQMTKEITENVTESVTEQVTKDITEQLTEKFEAEYKEKYDKAVEGLSDEDAIEKAVNEALEAQKVELTEAHEAEIAKMKEVGAQKEKLEELLESANLPKSSANALRKQFEDVVFAAVEESDDTEAQTSIEALESAVTDAIKEKRIELKEAGVGKDIHGLGESTDGSGDKKRDMPINDSIHARLEIN